MSGARLLWLLTPGITSKMLMEEAKRLRLIFVVESQGDRYDVCPKLSGLSKEDSLKLRDACYARLGIENPEEYERERMQALPAYKAWVEDRRKNPPTFRHRVK